MSTKDNSLRNFFLIAFLIPIVATVFVSLIDGLQSGLVTNQLSLMAMVVVLSMVHAPTIAAIVVAYRDEGFEGLKKLFRQLKYWKFESKWYLVAILVFPLSILASLLALSFYSQVYAPAFSFSILTFAVLLSALWEEIGWTGYAIPRMLKRFSPLNTAILFGVIHSFWHLAADYWGASEFYGNLYRYLFHFFLWMVGLIVLRIIILWIYTRTKSLVLSWLTHFSYTGGQLFLVSLTLTAVKTLLWNAAFVFVLLLAIACLVKWNKDFRDFWNSGLERRQLRLEIFILINWIKRIVKIALFTALAGIFVILSLTAIFVGARKYQPPIARNPVPDLVQSQPKDSLRVMTLNIAHGRADGVNQILQSRSSIEANLKDIAPVFLRVDPDAVALQEADAPSIWSGNFDHVQLLAEESQFPYYVHSNHVKSPWLSYGTAILLKLPVMETLSVTFQPTPPMPAKGFVLATVEWPDKSGRVVDLVSVHLDFSLREISEKQVREMIQTLSTRENPLIVMGDFNSEWKEEGSVVRLLAEALDLKVYDSESNEYITYDETNDRIDWILISNELEFKTYEVLSDRVSDHSAVVSEIIFSGEK